MLTWIRKLLAPSPATHRRAAPAARLRPRLYVLEDRLTPAVHEWTGQGVDNLWGTAANWTNGSPATDGSGDVDLVFHTNLTNAARLVTQNDIPALVVDSITFDATALAGVATGGTTAAGYVINGNTITINTGAAGQDPFGIDLLNGVADPGYVTTFNAGLTLATAAATFRSQDADARLVFNGNVNTGGQALTIDNNPTLLTNAPTTAGVELNGVLGGAGSLTKVGGGSLLLAGANTYAGGTTVIGGVLALTNNTSLGSVAATTTLNDPAKITLRGGITVQQALLNLNSNALNAFGTDGGTTNTFTGPVTLMAGAGGVAFGAGIGAADVNSRLVINGVIGGATSTLSLNGSGVVEFTQANTYTGLTNLNGNNGFGALQIDQPASAPAARATRRSSTATAAAPPAVPCG
jgi:autotransporter-associated beta strand protein